MEFDPDDIVDISCDEGYDPPHINILLAHADNIVIPKPFYDWIRVPLGLPDVVCGDS